MAESSTHMALVRRLVGYVQASMNSRQHLSVLHDLPGLIGCDKPPRLGPYRPDLYAADVPVTTVIVGEAKTSKDLETVHSRLQLRAYLRHLALYPGSTMILAVPWSVRVRAENLLRLVADETGSPAVVNVVIDDVEELPK